MSKSTKSLVKGIGQSIDIGGALTPRSAKSGSYASKSALTSDWKAVGRDIQKVVDKTGASKTRATKNNSSR